MKKIVLAVIFAALMIAFASPASAAGDGRSQGAWWFSISNQLNYTHENISPDHGKDIDTDMFSLGLRPVFFVIDGLGIEPSVAYTTVDTQGDGFPALTEWDYGIGLVYRGHS